MKFHGELASKRLIWQAFLLYIKNSASFESYCKSNDKLSILGVKTSLLNNLKSAFTIFFKLRQTLDKHLRISTLRIISKV